jgi:hypothetical protein
MVSDEISFLLGVIAALLKLIAAAGVPILRL